jgi:hypothetical protein
VEEWVSEVDIPDRAREFYLQQPNETELCIAGSLVANGRISACEWKLLVNSNVWSCRVVSPNRWTQLRGVGCEVSPWWELNSGLRHGMTFKYKL